MNIYKSKDRTATSCKVDLYVKDCSEMKKRMEYIPFLFITTIKELRGNFIIVLITVVLR